ncbi:MAG: hypothetical protein ACMXYE_04520 [Candidatus Woesearchaeota archaeon]
MKNNNPCQTKEYFKRKNLSIITALLIISLIYTAYASENDSPFSIGQDGLYSLTNDGQQTFEGEISVSNPSYIDRLQGDVTVAGSTITVKEGRMILHNPPSEIQGDITSDGTTLTIEGTLRKNNYETITGKITCTIDLSECNVEEPVTASFGETSFTLAHATIREDSISLQSNGELSIGSYALIEGEGTVKITDLNNIEVNPSHTMNVKLGNREATLSTPANINVEDREITLGERGIAEIIGVKPDSSFIVRSEIEGSITLDESKTNFKTNSLISGVHKDGSQEIAFGTEQGEALIINEEETTQYMTTPNSFIMKNIPEKTSILYQTSKEIFEEQTVQEGSMTKTIGNAQDLAKISEEYPEAFVWMQSQTESMSNTIEEAQSAFIEQANRIELMHKNPYVIAHEGSIGNAFLNVPQIDAISGTNLQFIERMIPILEKEAQDIIYPEDPDETISLIMYDTRNNQMTTAGTAYEESYIDIKRPEERSIFLEKAHYANNLRNTNLIEYGMFRADLNVLNRHHNLGLSFTFDIDGAHQRRYDFLKINNGPSRINPQN